MRCSWVDKFVEGQVYEETHKTINWTWKDAREWFRDVYVKRPSPQEGLERGMRLSDRTLRFSTW